MTQYQYECRITYGKFSYFLPPEWVFSGGERNDESLRLSVQKRWSVIKATDVTITHFKILQVRDDVKPSRHQIGA